MKVRRRLVKSLQRKQLSTEMNSLLSLVVIFLFTCGESLRVPRSSYSGRQLLVGYWGQNRAGPANGQLNYEKPLLEVCQTTKYDILAVSYVVVFFDPRNKGMPAVNFAHHCDTAVSPEYPYLLRCPKIEKGIKECQGRGKKVIMSIGGETGDGTLTSPAKAKEFAHTLYNLFLGGSQYKDIRPFGSAIMDGIDMDIEGGGADNYPGFIKELRTLMDHDPNKTYLITGAPQCRYPDHYLGPETPGTALEEAGQFVDHLYIHFYNNYCQTGAGRLFKDTLKKWLEFSARTLPKGPLIFIGLPAASGAAASAQYYRPPDELNAMYQSVKDLPGIGGIMLLDVSWDQNNVIDGQRYSEYAFKVLGHITVPQTKASSVPPNTAYTPSPTSSFSCTEVGDGFYPDPSADCNKYIECRDGVMSSRSCAAGLLFNPKIKTCVWSANVKCS